MLWLNVAATPANRSKMFYALQKRLTKRVPWKRRGRRVNTAAAAAVKANIHAIAAINAAPTNAAVVVATAAAAGADKYYLPDSPKYIYLF